MDSIETSMILKEETKAAKADFLSDVPIRLRGMAIQNVYNNITNKVYLFKNRDPIILAKTIPEMEPFRAKRSELIYSINEFSSHIYIIYQGRIALMNSKRTPLKEYTEGSYFGETEVLLSCPRKFTAFALEETNLAKIEKSAFMNLLALFPDLKKDVISTAITREIQLQQTEREVAELYQDFQDDPGFESKKYMGKRIF